MSQGDINKRIKFEKDEEKLRIEEMQKFGSSEECLSRRSMDFHYECDHFIKAELVTNYCW